MKRYIIGIIGFLALLLMSVSCTDRLNQEDCNGSGREFVLIASIDGDDDTKISYQASSGKLKQQWSEGDEIIGYSVEFREVSYYTFKFKEYSVGKAVFSYEGDTPPEKGTKLYVMYAPGFEQFGSSITADVSKQNQDTIPSFLFAAGVVNDKVLELSFKNQMALIAVVNPTFDYLSGDTLKNVKVSADNITSRAMMSVSDDTLSVRPITWYKYVESDCSLIIDEKGNTSGTIYLALFPNLTASDVKFTLTTSRKSYEFTVKDKIIEAGKCYTISPAYAKEIPEGALPGEFSVSDSTKVRFSQGNLCYTVKSGQWNFFDNQWDMDWGTPDEFITETLNASETEISLFTWGYDSKNSIKPKGTSGISGTAISSGNLSSAQDWGCVFGSGSNWRTLSFSEWKYLISRQRADKKKSVVFAEVPVSENTVIKGLILMPDEWDGTPELDQYTLTYGKWKELVFKGAVLLPAANYRNGDQLCLVDSNTPSCCYWTATAKGSTSAYCLDVNSNSILLNESSAANRSLGYSVRLVADVK